MAVNIELGTFLFNHTVILIRDNTLIKKLFNKRFFMRISLSILPITLITFALQSFAGENIDQSLLADDVNSVVIENLRGEVNILGWDKNEVSIKGELDDKAKGLIFERKGSSIKIKVKMPKYGNFSWKEAGSDLVIKLPKHLRVTFSGVSSDVELTNLNKSAEIKTVSGDIKAENLSDYVELASVSGTIKSQNLSGKIQLTTVSGRIKDVDSEGRLQLKSVSGDISSTSAASEVFANTVSGDIDLSLVDIDELSISTVSGDAKSQMSLNDKGLVKMSSVSGNLFQFFQEGVQASFKATASAGGDLINDITSVKAEEAKYGPSSKLQFETGNANARVKASTVSGTVRFSSK